MRRLFNFAAAALLLLSGCCGVFEPTVAGTRKWVEAEIPPGTSVADTTKALQRHGLTPEPPKYLPPDVIAVDKRVGSCLFSMDDDFLDITVWFDEHGRVVKTEVSMHTIGL
jgi:hypothetical protein